MAEKRLDGKVALVTGGSRGIGGAVTRLLAREGAQVIVMARGIASLEEIDDEVRAAGDLPLTLLPVDMADIETISNIGDVIAHRCGRLDILVGNAGTLPPLGPVANSSPEDWSATFQVNVEANLCLIRNLAPLLLDSPAGRAVFTGSFLARHPAAYWGAYAASKAALESIIRVWAAETEKTKLRVNMISPGAVQTEMLSKAYPGGYPRKALTPENLAPRFLDLVLPECLRHGEVIEIAAGNATFL